MVRLKLVQMSHYVTGSPTSITLLKDSIVHLSALLRSLNTGDLCHFSSSLIQAAYKACVHIHSHILPGSNLSGIGHDSDHRTYWMQVLVSVAKWLQTRAVTQGFLQHYNYLLWHFGSLAFKTCMQLTILLPPEIYYLFSLKTLNFLQVVSGFFNHSCSQLPKNYWLHKGSKLGVCMVHPSASRMGVLRISRGMNILFQ